MARASQGRGKIYASPKNLLAACQEYFAWVEDNPLYEAKLVVEDKEAVIRQVPKMRAMSINGLCIFLDISTDTWVRNRTYEEFRPIALAVESCIREQKFGAAAAGLLNANIISRDLGLVDRQEITGQASVQVITEDMTANQAAEAWIETLQEATPQLEDKRHAAQEGIVTEDDQRQHQDGDGARQTAKAGRGDRSQRRKKSET